MSGLTVEKMKEGFSKVRNKAIAKVFMDLKLMECWGSGIPRIIQASKLAGVKLPEIEDLGTGLKITVFRRTLEEERGFVVKESPKLYLATGQGSAQVISLIRENKFSTQSEIANKLNLSLSTVKRICMRLQNEGKIVRVGNNRAGFWSLS